MEYLKSTAQHLRDFYRSIELWLFIIGWSLALGGTGTFIGLEYAYFHGARGQHHISIAVVAVLSAFLGATLSSVVHIIRFTSKNALWHVPCLGIAMLVLFAALPYLSVWGFLKMHQAQGVIIVITYCMAIVVIRYIWVYFTRNSE